MSAGQALPRARSGKETGRIGELSAAEFLEAAGYSILIRNWRCPAGELDLVCAEGNTLVFVEVKSRFVSELAAAHVLDSVTIRKQVKLRQLVERFVARHRWAQTYPFVRIDVVGVLLEAADGEVSEIVHVKNAV
ncbi:MAG: YraN family protein [Bdellovibrionota bacterium]